MENIHKPQDYKKKITKKNALMSLASPAQKMNKNTNWKAAAFQNTF